MNQKIEELTYRKNIYFFLINTYYKEIDPNKARILIEEEVLKNFNHAGYDFELNFFKDFSEDKENELKREYARIFIGPGDHLPPYESIHNKNDKDYGRLWGEKTCHVKRIVEHFGLTFNGKDYHGIPDHISTEFEFMTKLIIAQIEAIKENNSKRSSELFNIQKDFFNEHIHQWVPQYADKLENVTAHNFYKEIAKLTRDFMNNENQIYSDKLKATDSKEPVLEAQVLG